MKGGQYAIFTFPSFTMHRSNIECTTKEEIKGNIN